MGYTVSMKTVGLIASSILLWACCPVHARQYMDKLSYSADWIETPSGDVINDRSEVEAYNCRGIETFVTRMRGEVVIDGKGAWTLEITVTRMFARYTEKDGMWVTPPELNNGHEVPVGPALNMKGCYGELNLPRIPSDNDKVNRKGDDIFAVLKNPSAGDGQLVTFIMNVARYQERAPTDEDFQAAHEFSETSLGKDHSKKGFWMKLFRYERAARGDSDAGEPPSEK